MDQNVFAEQLKIAMDAAGMKQAGFDPCSARRRS